MLETVKADLTRYTSPSHLPHRQGTLNPKQLARVLVTERTTWAVIEFRARQWAAAKGGVIGKLGWLVGIFSKHFVEIVSGVYIPTSTQIGPGLLISHFGPIIINGNAVIGEDFTLQPSTTIAFHDGGTPSFGDRVFVGPGARILGGIHIGDEALIGANAVVTKDVPAGHVALGPPATIRPDTREHWMAGGE